MRRNMRVGFLDACKESEAGAALKRPSLEFGSVVMLG